MVYCSESLFSDCISLNFIRLFPLSILHLFWTFLLFLNLTQLDVALHSSSRAQIRLVQRHSTLIHMAYFFRKFWRHLKEKLRKGEGKYIPLKFMHFLLHELSWFHPEEEISVAIQYLEHSALPQIVWMFLAAKLSWFKFCNTKWHYISVLLIMWFLKIDVACGSIMSLSK